MSFLFLKVKPYWAQAWRCWELISSTGKAGVPVGTPATMPPSPAPAACCAWCSPRLFFDQLLDHVVLHVNIVNAVDSIDSM